jgi:uncharacterized protein
MRHVAVVLTTALALLGAAHADAQVPTAKSMGDCRVGLYELRNGSDVDIGNVDGEHLRWRRKDGTSGKLTKAADGTWTSTLGWTDRADGKRVSFSDCGRGEIRFDGIEGHRVDFETTQTRFQGAGVMLSGRLVMPKGQGPVPVVVLVHGSEHDSARDLYALQRLFPSEGIGAFVYDKRGTGASGGNYTQDFLTLATDAIAATHEARRLAGTRAMRVGYQAGSQGGWVAPLAARIEAVDFVIVGFGLAVSPLEEDRSAIVLDMKRHGYDANIPQALEVADATGAVVLSQFRDGYDKVDAVRKRYGDAPWFKAIHGNISFLMLEKTPAELRELGPTLFPGAPLQYDPMPVLRNLQVPQLWILGEDDIDAPSAETASRLGSLGEAGAPITAAMFPHAEHGIYEYETTPDGVRLSTRQPDGYFQMMCDFIRDGRLAPQYGSSTLSRPSAKP